MNLKENIKLFYEKLSESKWMPDGASPNEYLAADLIKKQQEIIAELKKIIEYSDGFYYKAHMKEVIEDVKKKIKEMEEIDTDSN